MKKSVILAFLILAVTVGWLASGQIGNVNANDDNDTQSQVDSIQDINENTQEDLNTIKVETKKFIAEQIDQSITLQGQTIYNKKIDVKSEITGNITSINFSRGDRVKKNDKLLKISIENRKEVLTSISKDIDRLNKELIICFQKTRN